MMMVMMMITVVVAIELMTDEVPACVCKVSKEKGKIVIIPRLEEGA